MPLQIGIFGRGRLGSAIAAAAEDQADLEVAWILGRLMPADLAAVDVALEVSQADAVPEHLAWAARTGTNLVIGTTGWDPELLHAAAEEDHGRPAIGILTAPNFSLTVALMRRIALALGRYAALTGGDLAVTEVHHTGKVDSPSGTALLLRQALVDGSGQDVQTTSLRLGEVVGRHDVHLTSPVESITLRHEAHSRELFARGALTAARWLHGRSGTFTFDDLADEVLAPLFDPTPPQKEEP